MYVIRVCCLILANIIDVCRHGILTCLECRELLIVMLLIITLSLGEFVEKCLEMLLLCEDVIKEAVEEGIIVGKLESLW